MRLRIAACVPRRVAELSTELARFALAGALLVAALAKLADRSGSRESIIAFGAPEPAAAPLSWLLIGSELAIAAALLIGRWSVAGAVATLGLLAAFSVVVAVALARGRTPACNCFGRLSGGLVGWSTVARNALLGSMAGFIALGGREPVVFAALAAASCAAWLGLGPLRHRLRNTRASGFSLTGDGGERWTVDRLLDGDRSLLLVFGQPGCGACHALVPDLAGWQARLMDRLIVVLVVQASRPGELASDPRNPGYRVLLDAPGQLAARYGVRATPSAVLIDAGGRTASAVAKGGGEISALIDVRFAAEETQRIPRRSLIARAVRNAVALGVSPVVLAACGSSRSTSSSTPSTATTSTRPAALKIGNTYICRQQYALCTNAACVPSEHDPNIVVCDCVVESGYSVGFTSCPQRAPHGRTLYSTFSTEVAAAARGAMTCPADVAWANCLDAICELDPKNPDKARCQCPLVKQGPSFTFGGDCNTHTCGSTVWSGAHTNAGGPSIAAAMKRLGQPLVFPKPCPKA